MKFLNNKKLLGCIVGASLGIVTLLSIPSCYTAYQKNNARSLIEQTSKDLGVLENKTIKAEQALKDNSFLFSNKRDEEGLKTKIEEVKNNFYVFSNSITGNKRLFEMGEYILVRSNLDSGFQSLKDVPRLVARDSIAEEMEKIEQVILFCTNLRNSRDNVIANEFYLKARLKKPLKSNLGEAPEDISDMPQKYQVMIPIITGELENSLKDLPNNLNNSMGANLIKHRSTLEHITRFGKTPQVREKGHRLYDSASDSYRRVKPANDALVWYKTTNHDGKFSLQDYGSLAKNQRAVIDLIQAGDNSLTQLESYNTYLHEQEIVEVVEHTKETGKHYDFIKEKRIRHADFYYVLRTSTINGSSEESIKVGRKNGGWALFGWNYESPEQEIGWVREWKPLHDDRALSGWRRDLNPRIEIE